jgi:hypothetical protein
MMLGIGVEKSPDHALVLSVMFAGFPLEELDTSLAQRDGHFDSFVPKDEFLWARQEIRNNLEVSEWFVRVFDFLAHRFACLSASNRLRKAESRRRET